MDREKTDDQSAMPDWLRKLIDSHPPGTTFVYKATPPASPPSEDQEDDAQGS